MISTWGQRQAKQDIRVNTERGHSEQGKKEKQNKTTKTLYGLQWGNCQSSRDPGKDSK